MKVAIFAGGFGTRLQEETVLRPKPMVEIGGRPILWHIMKHYAHYGFNDFCIALGYLGDHIKEYFVNGLQLRGNLTVDFANGQVSRTDFEANEWVVNLMETGLKTNTGGRLKRMQDRLSDETFLITYGDGVSNVDLSELVKFHKRCGKLVSLTAVRPPARFGGLHLSGDSVEKFSEKPIASEGWINGGFMVCQPEVFDYITDDDTNWEADVLEKIAVEGQLAAFRHEGFWQCMDTLRDKSRLEQLWESGSPPWKTWPE